MGNQSSKNKNQLKEKKIYNITVYGAQSSGKSSLILQFVNKSFFESYDPTIEDTHKKELQIDDKDLALEINEMIDIEEFSISYKIQVIRKTQGFIYVVDISKKETEKKEWEKMFEYHMNFILDHLDSEKKVFPLVVFFNKSDLEEKAIEIQENEAKELMKYFHNKISSNVTYFYGSAKNDINVNDVFYEIIRKIDEHNLYKEKLEKKIE